MKVSALAEAIAEAERFIEVARKVKIETFKRMGEIKGKVELVSDYTKESAACKRASLDLTRALARLRKP